MWLCVEECVIPPPICTSCAHTPAHTPVRAFQHTSVPKNKCSTGTQSNEAKPSTQRKSVTHQRGWMIAADATPVGTGLASKKRKASELSELAKEKGSNSPHAWWCRKDMAGPLFAAGTRGPCASFGGWLLPVDLLNEMLGPRTRHMLCRWWEWDPHAVRKNNRTVIVRNAEVHDRAVPVALNVCLQPLVWVAPANSAVLAAWDPPLLEPAETLPKLVGHKMRGQVHEGVP
mmetsp:Transcript_117743/g.220151  ORF Transcript_117743/g.220151 Transcript_117743/m.220151 type:complete len:230 (+) Transcript_117743:126-815(+)